MTRSSAGWVLTTARNASLMAPASVTHRKPVLVMHERRRQHFFRQDEEPGIEEAGDDRRVLDQVRDFLDERGVILQVHAAAEPAGVHLEVAGDAVAAVGVAEDDEVLGEPGLILVEAADLDRAAGAAARGQEPVAVGQRTRFDVLHLRTRRRRRRGRS